MRIDKYIDAFDCSQDGYNWMCKTVQNEAMNVNIKEAAISRVESDCAKLQELIVAADSLDDVSFWEKLQVLDETDRYVVYQRFVEDKSYEQIGKDLNVTRAAICKRLKTIFKKLEKYLKKGKQN